MILLTSGNSHLQKVVIWWVSKKSASGSYNMSLLHLNGDRKLFMYLTNWRHWVGDGERKRGADGVYEFMASWFSLFFSSRGTILNVITNDLRLAKDFREALCSRSTFVAFCEWKLNLDEKNNVLSIFLLFYL